MIGSELTSTRSPRVTAARRLIKRAFRDRDGRFLAEGPQACREAAREPGVLIDLYVTTEAAQRHSDIVDSAKAAGAEIIWASGEVVSSLAGTITPQGMVGVCIKPERSLAAVVELAPKLVVLLAHARDPGNIGTVIRCADAAGADAVIVSDARVDLQLDRYSTCRSWWARRSMLPSAR